MPEHLRALVVILALGCPMLWIAQRALCPKVMSTDDFARRRNLWIGLTLAAFLSHNYWLFVVIATALILLIAGPSKERNPVATFLFVLFAVPLFLVKIPGMGVIEHLFELSHVRLLTILLLLPAALQLSKQPEVPRLGRLAADWFLLALLALQTIRVFSELNLTQSFRNIFYLYVDVLLLYYVCSRAIKNMDALREAFASLCVGLLAIAPIAAFEFARSWLVYSSLADALGLNWQGARYLGRGESIRALGPAGHSLALGYSLTIALGLWMGLRNRVSPSYWWGAAFMLVGGLIATLSKGPWVGAAVTVLIAVALGPQSGPRLVKFCVGTALLLVVIAISPFAERIIAYLPFVGTLDEGSVSYRARLFEVSMMVFWMNPILGSPSFRSNSLLEQMRQGEGIIDMVNSYLIYALLYGSVGVILFVGVFLCSLYGITSWMRRAPLGRDDVTTVGSALIATIIGMMVMIATVSSILAIPVIYWALGGLGVAYALVARSSATDLARHRSEPPIAPSRPSGTSALLRRNSRAEQ